MDQTDEDLSHGQLNVWCIGYVSRCKDTAFTGDKLMIGECHWLNDCYINFVQAMLRVQSPKCDGIKNTLLQNQVRLTTANKIVRILHIHNNHWMVIANVHCSEYV